VRPYEILSEKELYKGPIFALNQYEVELPGGRRSVRDVLQHNGASVIIPITADDKVVMVRQYREGSNSVLLELPAGKLDVGEDPQLCALRELEEETGYKAAKIRLLFTTYPVAAYCTEKISVFLAEDLTPGSPNPDSDEFVETFLYPLSDIMGMITTGEINDMKTIAGLLYYTATQK